MKKRLLSLFCALSLLLTLLPTSAFAVEGGAEGPPQTEDTEAAAAAPEEMELVSLTADEPDDPYEGLSGDDLLMGYLYSISGLDDEGPVTYGATKDLSSNEMKAVYEQFTTKLKDIAAGNSHDTKIELTSDSWPKKNTEWGLEESQPIWVDSSSGKGVELSSEMKQALKTKFNAKEFVHKALADLPYDLYWFYKTNFWSAFSSVDTQISDRNSINLKWVIEMPVAAAYADTAKGETRDVTGASGSTKKTFYFTTNNRPARVNTAVTKAQKVVTDCTATDNYGILRHYFEHIINEVDYDQNAANNANTPYGDPWQLINVFDGDSTTKVVCEGYAKAFKYLCDLTNANSSSSAGAKFSGNVDCYLVSGTMTGSDNKPGPHMWNIVNIDGNNYLVDVTNCDGGTDAATGGKSQVVREDLFLYGRDPESDGSYKYANTAPSADTLTYTYDEETKGAYTAETLKLATKSYQRPVELTVETAPTAGEATYGQTLNDVTLNTDNKAVVKVKGAADDTAVTGTWAWQDTSLSVGNVSASPNTFTAVFTPTPAEGKTYAPLTHEVNVTVNPKTVTNPTFDGVQESYPYDEKGVTPEFTLKDGDTEIPKSEYEVTYKDNDKAGTATITVTDNADGNYTVSGTKDFTIKAKAATISITTNENITYDGKAVEVDNTSDTGKDLTYTYTGDTSKTPTFTFYTDEQCTSKTTVSDHGAAAEGGAPKNAGTYWVKGTVEASVNYAAAESGAVKFTITPADYTYNGPTGVQPNVKINSAYPTTINDAKAEGVNSEEVTGTVKWYTNEACSTEASGSFTQEGAVTLWWQFTPAAGATNYVTAPQKNSVKFTVTALDPQTLTFTGVTGGKVVKTYGENEFTNAATNSTAAAANTITYESSNEKVATVEKNSGKVTIVGAGETTITATAAAVPDKYAEGKASYTLTVNKAELTIQSVTLAAKAYNGKTDATVDGVTFTGMKNSETLGKGDYTATGKFEDANAGDGKKVTVTVTLNDTDTTKNYTLKDGTFNKTDAKINKATYGDKTANGIAKFGTEGTVDLSALIVEGGTANVEGKPTDNDKVLDTPPPLLLVTRP